MSEITQLDGPVQEVTRLPEDKKRLYRMLARAFHARQTLPNVFSAEKIMQTARTHAINYATEKRLAGDKKTLLEMGGVLQELFAAENMRAFSGRFVSKWKW